jgi:transposase
VAVRLVLEPEEEDDSQWAAIESTSEKFGCTSETLRRWVRQAERARGQREGWTTGER